ncbi:MAG: PQQ-binding-like beta-propeller repeat protein [Butyrivibrio sp.]|nr:PQQ-binding-like beta-propeller repeat protein [Butyrivibrio sp.]MBR1640949.1 PQQ-binding-like beta-propeller repeat protein [Butyrivibrio sp.]
MRRSFKSVLILALTIILLTTYASGCGKEPSPEANTEVAQAEEAQTADDVTGQAATEVSTQTASEEPAEATQVRSATDGIVITNNEMYDGERKEPECDTLYTTIEGIEVWGQGELNYEIQPEGMILRKFIVKNKNSSSVTFRMEPLSEKDITGELMKHTGYTFSVHPNDWRGHMEPGEEYELMVDFSPTTLLSDTDYEAPLDIKLHVSVVVGSNAPVKDDFTVRQNLKVYSMERFSDDALYRGVVKGTVRDEDGTPITGAVVRGCSEYSIRRMYAVTDKNGEFIMRLPAFKTVYSNAWKETQLCVKKDGYNARQIIIYPKVGKEVSVDMTLFPENQLLKYEDNGSVDLKLQGYENTTDGSSIIAYIPFHTDQPSATIKDRIQVTAVDYDGNLLFEYPIPEEVPYIQGSKDGKYVVTVLNSSSDQTKATGWKTVILDRTGKEVYAIDHYPVEDREGWPSESEANNSISRCAGISTGNKYLFTSNTVGNFWVIDWQNNEILWQDYIYGQVRTIDFSEDDSLLYVSSGDGYYRCYTIDGELVWKSFVGTWVTKVKMTEDAIALTTKSGADTLKVLDKKTGKIRWTYPTMQTSLAIDVTPDGKYLWYGGHSSSAYSVIANSVFDMETGQIVYSLGYRNAIAGAFSGDGKIIAVADRKTVYVFNVSDGSYLWSKDLNDEDQFSSSFSMNLNHDGSRIVATSNTDKSANYFGQAYFFSLAGPNEDPEYDFNSIDMHEHPDLEEMIKFLPADQGGMGFDTSLQTSIDSNQMITLLKDSAANLNNSLLMRDFTISCQGHSLYLEGAIEVATGTMEITKVSKVDLTNLKLFNDDKASPGTTVIVIRGEDTKVTFPDDMGEGKENKDSNGFYWEKKNGSYLITYDGPTA